MTHGICVCLCEFAVVGLCRDHATMVPEKIVEKKKQWKSVDGIGPDPKTSFRFPQKPRGSGEEQTNLTQEPAQAVQFFFISSVCLSSRTFPNNYWDKFVKRKVSGFCFYDGLGASSSS